MAQYVTTGYVEDGYYQTGVSIDWGTKVIFVPQFFLTPIGGQVYQLDTDAFRLALKDLEDSEQGMVHPQTHKHNTSVLLGGIQYARIVEIINGYTITFENGSYVVNLVGSNNNILDVTNLNLVQVRSNNSAGLINVTEIQQSSFQNSVWVDQVNGVDYSTYPAGTPSLPVKTITNAKVIAEARGFKKLFFLSSYTLADSDVIDGYLLQGLSPTGTVMTLSANATVANCQFENLHCTGSIDDDCTFTECEIHDLLLFRGVMRRCSLHGTVSLSGNVEADMLGCYSGEANAPVILDCGGSGQSAALRAWSGKIQITNKTGALDTVAVDMIGGEVILDLVTVTEGKIAIQGNGECKDTSGNYLQHGYIGNLYVDNYAMNGQLQQEMWKLMGLDPTSPLQVTDTSRTAGGITQTVVDDGTTTTVTRQ